MARELKSLDCDEYTGLHNLGLLFEFYPEATGDIRVDLDPRANTPVHWMPTVNQMCSIVFAHQVCSDVNCGSCAFDSEDNLLQFAEQLIEESEQ